MVNRSEKKQSWLKFNPQDWRGDAKLRVCSIGARGLWIEMICVMHEAIPYGHLLVGGRSPSVKQLATLAGISYAECERLLGEIELAGVYSKTSDGVIYSRRMVRDRTKADQDRENGHDGGNPTIRRGTVPKEKRVRPYRRSDSPEKTLRIFGKTGGRCHWCSVALIFYPDGSPSGFHVDHVLPVCDGGTNDEANLVPSCASCNHKRARLHDPTATLSVNVGNISDFNPDVKAKSPESRVQNDAVAADAGARGNALVGPEASELAEKLLVIAGHDPAFWPPGWCGAPLRVQTWLNQDWPPEIIVAATQSVVSRKRGEPAASVQFFEKAIAAEVARQAQPLPVVDIRNPENVTGARGQPRTRSGSLIDAIDRELAQLQSSEGADLELPEGAVRRLSN